MSDFEARVATTKELTDIIFKLREENARLRELAIEETGKLRDENEKLKMAMHDIYEIYAGSEGFKPETCPEAYLQDRIKEMAYIAAKHKRVGGEND